MVEASALGRFIEFFRQHWKTMVSVASAAIVARCAKWLRSRWKRWCAMRPQIIIASTTDSYGRIIADDYWGLTLDITNQLGRAVDCVRARLEFRHETGLQYPKFDALIILHKDWVVGKQLTMGTIVRLEEHRSASVVIAVWVDREKPQAPATWPPDNRYPLRSGKWEFTIRVDTEISSAKQKLEGELSPGRPLGFKTHRGMLRRLLF
jgi:hypothetical protein